MIAAVGLRKSFGATVVLEDVSLEVPAGQCLALLGPNGAGKTTLLRVLGTLARPSAGRLASTAPTRSAIPTRSVPAIGMVAHGSYVYEDLTALENLRFWAVMGGLDARPDRLRERAAGGGARRDGRRARAHVLGGHEAAARPRAGDARPARACCCSTSRSAGSTAQGQKWLGDFLLAFKAGGGAIVLATHGFATALAVADRAVILAGGRIVLDRPAAGLGRDELHRLYDDLIESGESAPR